ncbi:MAG: hypothetical protein ACE15F_19915 [bacterium]
MDNLIELLVILAFLIIGGMQNFFKNLRGSEEEKDTTPDSIDIPHPPVAREPRAPLFPSRTRPPQPPRPSMAKRARPISTRRLPAEPPRPTVTEAPTQRKESTLMKVLRELLEVEELPEPVDEPRPRRRRRSKPEAPQTPPPVQPPQPSTQKRVAPAIKTPVVSGPSPLVLIARRAEKEPLRASILLSEILKSPRGLQPFTGPMRNPFANR